MKLFFVILFVAAAATFASSTLTGHVGGEYTLWMPATDDVIDTNALTEPDIFNTAFASFTDYYVADDFTPSANYAVTDVTWWTLTTGAVPDAGDLEVLFYTDLPPGPGTLLWTGVPTAVSLGNTGLTFAGYVIWQTQVTLPDTDYFNVVGGTTYWVSMHRTDGTTLYIILDSIVRGTELYRIIDATGWVAGSSTGSPPYDPTDVFQIIEGTATAIERETWGSIKSIF